VIPFLSPYWGMELIPLGILSLTVKHRGMFIGIGQGETMDCTGKEGEQNPMELQQELKHLAAQGIQADPCRIREDMCAQFHNRDEWVREYAVNASDAGARACYISAYGNEKTLIVAVEDDGCGMDRQGVIDFCAIFRSMKHGDSQRTVGTHGVGKLSPAAVPGQSGFVMRTSTDRECWRMEAGSLLESTSVQLERVEPVPARGTRFEITFENRDGLTPTSKLKELSALLEGYLRHFGFKIVLFETGGMGPDKPMWAKPVGRIYGEWGTPTERMGRKYTFQLRGNQFKVVMGLGTGEHEVYQKKVLVTKRYNLLCRDLPLKLVVPHLKIRVDSPDFELPFGRNCLRNEEVLVPLSRYLREEILPEYFEELLLRYESGILKDQGLSSREVEEIACALLLHDDTALKGSWRHLPLFRVMNAPRRSLSQLQQVVHERGVLYLEVQPVAGTDYGAFNGPVISDVQPKGGIEVLKKHFVREMVILGQDDVILEMAARCSPGLGEKEKRFEQCLGFQGALLNRAGTGNGSDGRETGRQGLDAFLENREQFEGVVREGINARQDLLSLKWRVNYLVHRDGKTACTTHRFMLKGGTVVLNLSHPEVKKLVGLSEKDPGLAGHWATAMCLGDESKILDHIMSETREDLLVLDAMCKVEAIGMMRRKEEGPAVRPEKFRDFLRDLEDPIRWLH